MNRHFASVSLAACLSLCLLLVSPAVGQMATNAASASSLPRLVRFTGVGRDLKGTPLTGAVGITFALYTEQTGGAPLWLETQNVTADSSGHYSVLLGSTKPEGLPSEMFASEQARWIGVQVSGQAEQPRVLLVSAPYALKAGDAETLGGLPPSAFMLAAPPLSAGSATANGAAQGSAPPPASSNVTTTGGTVNAIPLFSTATNIQNSAITQTGTGATAKIGIGVANPAAALDIKGGEYVRGVLTLPASGVATATKGANSQAELMIASAFNSGTAAAVNQKFQLQAEPAGNDTASASGTLNLLYGSGAAAPTETGFKINSLGQITFATGQTFPGTGAGTITGVTAGTGLTGGGTTGAVTLNVDSTAIPLLAVANTFTGNQTVNGNLSATGLVTGSAFQIGSSIFASGNLTNANTFTGFAGNANMSGQSNTGSGIQALQSNTTGSGNTASGIAALFANTTGSFNTGTGVGALSGNNTGTYNTATGVDALFETTSGRFNTGDGSEALQLNTTGNYNTAIGNYAGLTADSSKITGSSNTALGAGVEFSTGTLTNATAIGAGAEVSASNSMVLGAISGVNGATGSTNVGIGTTAPTATLDVRGTGNFTGLITFATGQVFPGAVTAVNAGTDLTITKSGSTVTLNTDTTKVPQLGVANTFTANQTFNGSVAAVGDARIDINGVNAGSYTPAVRFGSGNSGEAIASDRTGSTNVNGIDFYTGFAPRLSVTNAGSVGIGTTSPSYTLDVRGTGGFSSGVVGANAMAGQNSAASGTSNGVYGGTSSSAGTGVVGVNFATSGSAYGIYGQSSSTTGTGVYGTGGNYGVYGTASDLGGIGVTGIGPNAGIGVWGIGSGRSTTGSNLFDFAPIGLWGDTGTAGGTSIGALYSAGVLGTADDSIAIFAENNSSQSQTKSPTIFAANLTQNGGYMLFALGQSGNFCEIETSGGLNCSGIVGSPALTSRIDHPLAPSEKYINHASVESSEMKNMYDGNVTTDNQGNATVQLPEWFEALNTDFRYQLTVIGQFAQAIVSGEVANHQFSIRTNKPNVKVSWQITGVRQDAFAKAHPLVVEQQKDERERGHYIHPELYGASEEQSVAFAQHSGLMKKTQEERARQVLKTQTQSAREGPQPQPLAIAPALVIAPQPSVPAGVMRPVPAQKQAAPRK